jgi:RNA polymerase sigma factor (sigma-70 family)
MIPDTEIRTVSPEVLIQQYRPLIFKLAMRYSQLLAHTPSVDYDDLYQAGMMALLRVQQVYDPEQGSSFISFAAKPVKWYMMRTLGIDRRQIPPLMESLDAPTYADDPEGETLLDSIPDPNAPEGYAEAKKQSVKETVQAAVAGLKSEKQRAIIQKVYFEEKTRHAVADEIGMKYGAVSAAEHAALQKLHKNWILQQMAGYRPHHYSLSRFRHTFCSEEEAAVLRTEKIIDAQYGDGAYMAMRDALFM